MGEEGIGEELPRRRLIHQRPDRVDDHRLPRLPEGDAAKGGLVSGWELPPPQEERVAVELCGEATEEPGRHGPSDRDVPSPRADERAQRPFKGFGGADEEDGGDERDVNEIREVPDRQRRIRNRRR
jgi:hypothetical protein